MNVSQTDIHNIITDGVEYNMIKQQLLMPTGWYCVAFSKDVKEGQIISDILCKKEIIVYRSNGQAVVASAYCPHLGAHLGHGGKINGDGEVVCPFHGFRFNNNGHCVETGYCTKPAKNTQLSVYPTHETNGLILAFYDHSGSKPSWSCPEIDVQGLSKLQTDSFEVNAHIQDLAENSCDLGHFQWVHSYNNASAVHTPIVDGPTMKGRYRFERVNILRFGPASIVLDIKVDLYGLGYNFVDYSIEQFGLYGKIFLMFTPLNEHKTRIRLGLHINRQINYAGIHPLLAWLPEPIAFKLMKVLIFKSLKEDLQSDFAIWDHKMYLPKPKVAKGDGPIYLYRRFAYQFYQDLGS
ncbi:hypothetical protein AB835_12810 [Candidatus Endobugula sertula]|uniref:cholesterol 7-desaturase n=1 Tax=Candidatus Endobugula sertula TaxID=62101 RepID=A0A1D2QM93_9GAMM|nr:hypothetical protein AB835_12810 [Candidatus Endobugula sertula]